jgi:hypothetical protein
MTTDGISPFRNIYLGDSTVIGIIMYNAAFKWKTWLHKFLCECYTSIFFQLLLITKKHGNLETYKSRPIKRVIESMPASSVRIVMI